MEKNPVHIHKELYKLEVLTPGQLTELNLFWDHFYLPNPKFSKYEYARYKRARHSVAVALILLTVPSNIDKNQAISLSLLGLFHDLGKVHPNLIEIQSMDGPKTDEQIEALEKHPNYAALYLENLGLSKHAEVIDCHHEKIDGTGYPNKLIGENIPLLAGLLGIADKFAAATYIDKSLNNIRSTLGELKLELGKTIDERLGVVLEILSERFESDESRINDIYRISEEIAAGWEKGEVNKENSNIVKQIADMTKIP